LIQGIRAVFEQARDFLERVKRIVVWEAFRPVPDAALDSGEIRTLQVPLIVFEFHHKTKGYLMVRPDASGAKRRSPTTRKEHDQGGRPPFDAMPNAAGFVSSTSSAPSKRP
jgi:hypothetical protein